MPGFEPVFDPIRSLELIEAGERLQPTIGGLVGGVATAVLAALAAFGTWRWIAARLRSRSATPGSGDDDCCSG